LRSKFQEYTRRPRDQFRHIVDRALTKYLNAHSDDAVVFFTNDNNNNNNNDNDDESASERAARMEASGVLNGSLLAAYSAHTPISVPPASPGGSVDTAIPIDADDNAASTVTTPLSGSVLRKRKRALGSEKRKAASSGASAGADDQESTRGSGPIPAIKSDVTFADIGGIDDVLQDLEELVHYPLMHPEIYEHLGVDTPCGILLHGPSGVGKTQLARAIAGEYNVPFYQLAAPEVVSGVSGESESKIRDIFDKARATAPSIIFIDEIDVISAKRDTAQREMERRIVAQLLASMDALQARSRPIQDAQRDAIVEAIDNGANQAPVRVAQPLVIVIGATNRADAIDPALRRAGRFDREIAVPIPSERARAQILELYAKRLRLADDVNIAALARLTPGYVGADLQSLAKEAAVAAINRIFSEFGGAHASSSTGSSGLARASERERVAAQLAQRAATAEELRRRTAPLTADELAPLAITMADFNVALKRVQPSARREGFAVKPNVSWSDVGALEDIRSELEMALVRPILQPEMFERLGIATPAGILLYGPPGCGKCLARDTPVLMHSGDVKLVQDVAAGDWLMGDDSTPRLVLSTTTGREQMARVSFAASASFSCNMSHVLSLKLRDAPSLLQRANSRDVVVEWFDAPRHSDGTVAMLLRRTRTFHSDVSARKFVARLRDMEPLAVAADETVDISVRDLLNEKRVAKATLVRLDAYRAAAVDFAPLAVEPCDARRVGATARHRIVSVYKRAARSTRLELLAGVCDVRASPLGSSGSIEVRCDGESALADDVAFVARSLGLLAVVRNDRVHIDTSAQQREAFAIEVLGDGQYFGFELSGNHRFVLAHNFVVSHNTLLAKAIANQAGANFISIKGPELLDKYVGESEKAVRQVFARAAAASPCIIFFDELDALCGRRQGDGGNQAGERVVNQLLTEMDGVGERKQIYVVGATNRPDMIDGAMLRPGRLDKLLYVPLPDANGRASILRASTRSTPLGPDVDLARVGADQRAVGFSGADLASLVRESAIAALRESFDTGANGDAAVAVQMRHFDAAFEKVQPSVSRADEKLYDRMRSRLRVSRAKSAAPTDAETPSDANK
jgi:SpoVK/Ycf46/Vps4 family AAA+-type ATPase